VSLQPDGETDMQQERVLIQKIRSLPRDKVSAVEDFVDFLSQKNRDYLLLQAGNNLAEQAFKKVWDNSEDQEYDRL